MPDETGYPFEIEFYEEDGDEPVLRWMRDELSPSERRALGLAMRHYLQKEGTGVCRGRWGKSVGDGVYEFRLDENLKTLCKHLGLSYKKTGPEDTQGVLFRVFFHQYDDKVLLLLNGYDKGKSPSAREQQRQIALAKARLRKWKAKRVKQAKDAARTPKRKK